MLDSVNTPQIKDWFVPAFMKQANYYASLYGAPIWFVGSGLRSPNPSDLDIRVVLSDLEFWRMYGRPIDDASHDHEPWDEWRWRRAADNLKRSRRSGVWGGYRIDFQVLTVQEAQMFKDQDKIRLDTAPDWVLSSGLYT